VQRIQEAKIAAKAKGRDSADIKIPTDSFTVACAQSCPTEAIVFGDIKGSEERRLEGSRQFARLRTAQVSQHQFTRALPCANSQSQHCYARRE
jgi:Fe-S-cluster-containing dehydrogenase component